MPQPRPPGEAACAQRRVLIVDDEESMRDLVQTALDFVGYEVATATNGLEALTLAGTFLPDLIVLDVLMPGVDGLEVCRRLRADGDTTPVIFLTARDTPQDTIEGLATGGDDYLTKPFHLQVLIARVEAVLRRTHNASGAPLGRRTYADVVLDEGTHRAWRGDEPLALSPTEFRLLRYLLMNAELVLSKAQIAENVWSYDFDGDPNVVETYVSYLRKKLDRGRPKLIHTIWGVGYTLRTHEA